MLNQDDYMACTNPLHFDIDKDISVEMVKDTDSFFIAIYNDQNNSSVSFQVSGDKLKGLADFISRNLGHN